jgi:hypothetical protein
MADSQTNTTGNHAVVFGCSGINGWALVNQLLSGYPSAGSYSKITAIANRPFTAHEAKWPIDDRLQIVSGIDLLAGDDAQISKALADKVSSVETVSHIYYAGKNDHFNVSSVVFILIDTRANVDHF